MAIKQLTPEQVRTMSLEEKDAWWLANVYRGDMPQLTLRSGITGMLLGGFLSLTNLYVGARTGWALGVGVTSVILSFAIFKVFARLKLGKEMTVLENNAMQSIATAAGYMNQALVSSFAAYTMVTARIVPMYQVMVWLFVVAVLGVLFAFPMKKRFINDEQLPFPEGMAAGVVMDALHEADEKEGLFKAKLLLVSGSLSGLVELARSDKVMRWLLSLPSLPEYYDELIYQGRIAAWLKEKDIFPGIRGVSFEDLTIRFDTSLIFVATGGITGIRTGVSLLVGGLLDYFVLAPWCIQHGYIHPKNGHYGFRQITMWALWGGVACMTTSSLYSFFSKPKAILDALKGVFARKGSQKVDVLEHIELPIKVSLYGVPIAGALLVTLGHAWFGISYWLGALAIPLVFVFALIAVNATALTSLTPTSALGKLTQLTYGVLAPHNITTNLMTAAICADVSGNASNLLADIKPGYMLGGKPRHQAAGHVLGALAGLLVSVPVWYLVFIHGDINQYGSSQLPVPSAITWRAVSELLMNGLDKLEPTARTAVVIGAAVGIVCEAWKALSKNKFPLSAVGLGLAFILPFATSWTMFLGAFLFWMLGRRTARWEGAAKKPEAPAAPPAGEGTGKPEAPPTSKKPWFALASENTEAICAGVIAGGALMGIGVKVLEVLVLPDVATAVGFGKAVLGAAARGRM